MFYFRSLFLTVWLFVSLLPGSAQILPPGQYTSSDRKAIKSLEEGRSAFELKNDTKAEKSFLNALDRDNNFIEAALGLANLYQLNNRHREAIDYFSRAIAINPKFYPNAYYFLSQSQLMLGLYQEAKNSLDVYLRFERLNPNTRANAEKLMANATFGAEAVKNPQPFNPRNAGPGINTELNEYFPAITGDGNQFIFTRALKVPEIPDYENEDFFISQRKEGEWRAAQPVREINSQGNEGAPSLSADGTIMFFASCANEFGDYGVPDRKGYGSCDIFYSQRINGSWTRPRNAGSAINTAHWETQPSYSSDGRTLYFIRGIRAGRSGIREQDIYMSEIGEDGRFSDAVKLPDHINTPGREESVFVHPDNQTLYFSSDGHPGMGGLDLYMCKRGDDGQWGKPVNLGYPINTFNDENSLLVDPAGAIAFFASDRKGGFGGLDVYEFDLPESMRPEKITYVKGKIFDARTKAPLEANFELIELETGKLLNRSRSQANGEFFATLNAGRNYIVNANREGYLFFSDNFSMKGKVADFKKPFVLNVPIEPIDTGHTVELKNVFFDVNKWELKPESKAELDKLIAFLTKNTKLMIEIGGHTDNSGDRKFNQLLSTNRAKSVYEYLIIEGKIDPTRLSYKGYAETKPLVPNDSPENKARNRRTEFKVVGK